MVATSPNSGCRHIRKSRPGKRCSPGAMNSRVPTRLTGVSMRVSIARPQSQSWVRPSAHTTQFSGFRSFRVRAGVQ